MTEEVFEQTAEAAEQQVHQNLGFVHISEETATWLEDELSEWWDATIHDSVHYTYHISKALMELRSELRMEIEK